MGGGRISRNLSICGVAMTVKNHNTSSVECPSLDPQVVNTAPYSQDAEIPAPEWAEFLNSFSDQHEGWLVTVTVVCGSETSTKVTSCRLQSIALIQTGNRFNIPILVLGAKGPHVIHEVTDPVRLTFKRDARGAHKGLDITAADHSITTVRFRKAAFPETLDGVLPEDQNVM